MQKARDALHVAWEKFSSVPHLTNLQEVRESWIKFDGTCCDLILPLV